MGSMLRLTSSCGACGDLRRSIKRRALIIALDKAFTSASLELNQVHFPSLNPLPLTFAS
ncbi:MAG: hypothetical protein ACTS4X_00640 [Candidatus Hodgkinia cicadicola]